jgi:hypothetical protein
MTDSDPKPAARARIRAFLDARTAYAASLPPGAARYAMTDEITRQATDSSAVTLTGSQMSTVVTLDATAHMAGTVPLLESDLALLAGDEGDWA